MLVQYHTYQRIEAAPEKLCKHPDEVIMAQIDTIGLMDEMRAVLIEREAALRLRLYDLEVKVYEKASKDES
jgi:hypothetical protein